MVEELAVKYKDKVNVLGLLCDVQRNDGSADPEKIVVARNLMEIAGANFTNIMLSREIIGFVSDRISVTPTVYFVDSKGYLKGDMHVGAKSVSAWSEIIDELL